MIDWLIKGLRASPRCCWYPSPRGRCYSNRVGDTGIHYIRNHKEVKSARDPIVGPPDRPGNLITWSTRRGQLDHLERKKNKKILHKHDNVKEGSWLTRSVDTDQRETKFSTCNMNLNSKQCNLDIRRNFFN